MEDQELDGLPGHSEAVSGAVDGEAAAFTPGPWVAKMQFGEWFVRQDPKPWDGNGYQLVCNLPAAKKGSYSGDMFAANARLIAAAPDLLDGCNALLGLVQLILSRDDVPIAIRHVLIESHRLGEARTAIARATDQ